MNIGSAPERLLVAPLPTKHHELNAFKESSSLTTKLRTRPGLRFQAKVELRHHAINNSVEWTLSIGMY